MIQHSPGAPPKKTTSTDSIFSTVVGIATIGAFVLAIPMLIIAVMQIGGSSTASGPTPAAVTSSSPLASRPATADSCIQSGQSADCGAVGSGVVVAVQDCSPDGIKGAWGYHESVQLAVITTESAEGCSVFPSSMAAAAGARGRDVQLAAEGDLPAVLLECSRRDGQSSVACNDPHEIEFVSGWKSGDASASLPVCRDLAIDYTENALDADSPIRSLVFPRSDGMIRCAVGAEGRTLEGSLRGIGGDEPPYAG